MSREWAYLKMHKRAGRGHEEDGCQGATDGELAILCPACPQPDINLPADWESAHLPYATTSCVDIIEFTSCSRYLYLLILALDACFRLKNRLRPCPSQDVGLGTGLSYFVPNNEYSLWFRNQAQQQDVSQ